MLVERGQDFLLLNGAQVLRGFNESDSRVFEIAQLAESSDDVGEQHSLARAYFDQMEALGLVIALLVF